MRSSQTERAARLMAEAEALEAAGRSVEAAQSYMAAFTLDPSLDTSEAAPAEQQLSIKQQEQWDRSMAKAKRQNNC